ncbi:40S ribosomal protein S11 [Capsicum chinense]|nr:40S ribosomal protein S11 [Capsicum chinense]
MGRSQLICTGGSLMVTVQYSNDYKDDKNEALHNQYIFHTDVPHEGLAFHAAGTDGEGIFEAASSKKTGKGKRPGKGGNRYFKSIGLGFKTPREAIEGTYIDKKCPFTGNVSIRGRILAGTCHSAKMNRTIIVRRNYLHYVKNYFRYEKRHSNIPAHISPCFRVKEGDHVIIGQCRPLSKTVRFNVLKVIPAGSAGGGKKAFAGIGVHGLGRGIPRGQPFPKENNIGVGEENVVGVFLTGVTVLTHGVVRDSNMVHELVGGESVVLKNPEEGQPGMDGFVLNAAFPEISPLFSLGELIMHIVYDILKVSMLGFGVENGEPKVFSNGSAGLYVKNGGALVSNLDVAVFGEDTF